MMTIGGTSLTIVAAIVIYLCLYPFVDRICKCIEHCADAAKEAAREEENEDE